MALQMVAMVVMCSLRGGPSWPSVEPPMSRHLCQRTLVCSMVLQMASMVRSCLQGEASRGSGGGGFFLPVARLSHQVLVGTLWRV
jgi:hypothetical protein